MNREREGELYMLAESVLWSLFPIISLYSFKSLPPILSAGVCSLAAAVFFFGMLGIRRRWKELFVREAWRVIFIATLFLGIGYYSLVFVGTSLTSANNVSIMLLMEVFFSMVILRAIGKEHLRREQVIGACCMVCGAALVLLPGKLSINSGDLILLGANALPPIGNYFQQLARKMVSASTMLFYRSLISGVVLTAAGLATAQHLPTGGEWKAALPFILLNGFLMLGLSKIFWIEAIHRIPISKAVALATLTPLFTVGFSYLLLNEYPTVWQLTGLPPIMVGAWFITRPRNVPVT